MMRFFTLFLFAALGLTACWNTRPGSVRSASDTSIVTITAGKVLIPSGWVIASYIIDPQAQSCWFHMGEAPAPLPCERLAGFPAAARYLTWLPQHPAAPPATSVPEPPPADDPADSGESGSVEPPPAPMRGGAAAAGDL